jgi:ABC-type transporter Mla MlaB component
MADDDPSVIALPCDVSGLAADLLAIDVLARLALAARRRGRQVRLRGASAELRALIAFAGLEDVLGDSRGKAEQREQPLGR